MRTVAVTALFRLKYSTCISWPAVVLQYLKVFMILLNKLDFFAACQLVEDVLRFSLEVEESVLCCQKKCVKYV